LYIYFIGTEVLALPNGPCPINKKLCDISEQLKPYIRDLIDHSNTVSIKPIILYHTITQYAACTYNTLPYYDII
jgi:hypothetical protein